MKVELLKKILQHSGSLYAVCYLKSKNLLLTGGADKIVASWDFETYENTPFSIKTNSAILTIQTIMQDKYLLVGLFNGNFHIIDIETKQEVKFIPFHKSGLFACTYIEDKNILVLGSGDGTYSIWNCDDFSLLNKGKLSNSKIRTIVSEGNEVYIGTTEGNIIRINLHDFSVDRLMNLPDNGINSLVFLPQKKVWLAASKNAHVIAVDLINKKEVFSFPAHNWPIYKVINIEDWGIATCSRDKTIKIWDNKSLDLLERMEFRPHKGHTHSINNLLYIESKKTLVSIGDDKAICFWKIEK